MRTTLLLTAAGAALVLAACSKPAEKAPPAAPAAEAPPGGPGGPGGPDGGGFRGPESQTLAQMQERTKERFAQVDADGDGKITADEIEAAEAEREARMQDGGGPGGAGGPGGPGGGGGFRGGGLRMLARADTDKDGVITLAEAQAQAKTRFEAMDANHDGTVTRDEMRAAFEARRNAAGGGDGPPQ